MRSKLREADYKFYTWMALSFSLTIIALGLIGCAKKSAPEEKANVYTFETPKQLTDAVTKFAVECDGECPQNAGALLAIDMKSLTIHSCTFALVAKDIILTNLHCLPASVAKAGASCQGTLQAMFAKAGDKDVYHCDKILSVSESRPADAEYGRDYAFIKLSSETNRTPLRINTSGLADGEILTALVATPINEKTKRGSTLQKITCKTHMNSYVSKGFTHPLSPVAAFKNCNIVPGNSGASMLNAAGEIKAIAQTSYLPKQLPTQPKTLSEQLAFVQHAQQLMTGTNAACINNQELDLSSARNGCIDSPAKYSPDIKDGGFDEKLETERQASLVLSMSKRVPSLKFRLTMNAPSDQEALRGLQTTVHAIPECVRKPESPLSYQTEVIQYVREIDENARLKVRTRVETRKVTLTLKSETGLGLEDSLSENFLVSEVSHAGKSRHSGVKKKTYSLKSCAP